MSKLLDDINIKIVSELVRQPDMSSLALAKKLDIPLSTLQRRRARIEKAIPTVKALSALFFLYSFLIV
jgi:DNA-binding Lrp family transcriptional regulator